MAQQLIITTPANSGLGDSPKSAFDKVNANFTDLYGGTSVPVITASQATIGPPAGGIALTVVSQSPGSIALSVSDGTNVINLAPAVTGVINVNNALNLSVAGTPAISISSSRTVTVGPPTSGVALTVTPLGGNAAIVAGSITIGDGVGIGSGGNIYEASGSNLHIGTLLGSSVDFTTNSVLRMTIASGGAVTLTGPIGVNGNAAPAQSTGWGTPVGGAVVASYNITDAGGANSNTNKALAQVIAVLKSVGLLGA